MKDKEIKVTDQKNEPVEIEESGARPLIEDCDIQKVLKPEILDI